MKTAKTKANYSAKDLSYMKKTFTVFTILFPAVLTLSLLENFFTSKRSWKVQAVEFCVEWWQTAKILFGGTGYDYSIEIADYSFKLEAKKNKFDVKVAQELAYVFSRYNLYFSKTSGVIRYNTDDVQMKITQTGKDSFVLFYDKFKWGKRLTFTAKYSMTAEQLLTVVKVLER